MRAFFTQQQLRAGAQQHAAVRERHVEVIAGRVLGDQALEQRPAIHPFAGGDINQAREDHFVHFRRRGEGRRARHHRHEGVLFGDLPALHHVHRLLPGRIARGVLLFWSGEGFPACGYKQLGRLAGIKRNGADHYRLSDPGSPRRCKGGSHFALEFPVQIFAIGGRMRKPTKAASGGEAAVRRHKEEAFRRQSHFFLPYFLSQRRFHIILQKR